MGGDGEKVADEEIINEGSQGFESLNYSHCLEFE